jgi:formylglycine-generating enzyme required for sulfatase activity
MLLKIIITMRYRLAVFGLLAFFAIAVPAQSAMPPTGASPAEELSFWEELAFWEAVKDSQNPAEFEAYLQTYPDGRFATLARVRIRALKGGQSRPQENNASPITATPPVETPTPAPSTESVTIASEPATAAPSGSAPMYYIATTTSNVRSAPTTRADKVGLLREGEQILVLGEEADGWYKVQTDKGDVAYIFASLLQPAVTEEPNTGTPSAIGTAATAPADLKPGTVFRDCEQCPQMVVIPAGQFEMGFENGRSEEKPVHSVTIPVPFALGVYEVTYGEWDICVDEEGCRHHPIARGEVVDPKLPVSNISWDDARQFVSWLSEKTGERYRLPSEAEWEYAARAGTTTVYWWGDEAGNNQANCQGCGSQWDNRQAAPVGSFQANPFGLYDVHGNVWEWTADCWNDSYKKAPADGSAWLQGDCVARVLRSGAWKQDADYMRAARRSWYDRDVRYYLHGVRVARSLR